MKYMDLHCDTLMYLGREGFGSLEKNTKCVDFSRMRKGEAYLQCFAIWMLQESHWAQLGAEPEEDEAYIERLAKGLQEEIQASDSNVALVRDFGQIEENRKAGKLSAVLTMEDGRAVNGKLENLNRFYQMGVRMMALLWNHENCLGYPNSADPEIMKKGLKPFGIQAVERMNELGMVVDVSHLNDGGFYDVARFSKKPFVASHSNARSLSPHRRNLTDDMIRILAEHGGVAGLNFCPGFLQKNTDSLDSTIERMTAHIKHMVMTGGIECVAIGTDFDGMDGNLEIGSPGEMNKLWEALKKEGFSYGDLEKIAWKNGLRVWLDNRPQRDVIDGR